MTDLTPAQVTDDYAAAREFVRRAFVTGTAVTLPLIITLIVLGVVIEFVSQQLNPIVGFLTSLTGVDPASQTTLKVATVVFLAAAIFLVGAVVERYPEKSEIGVLFESLVSRIPGLGSLYRSLDEMSGLLLDNDTDSFQEVKLVEFPTTDSYSLAFLTADTPDIVREATDTDRMVTVFLPMAPNPVMGGYVLHVAESRVYDVDLTVEEGIQSIVTSGVATGQRTSHELSEDMLDRINRRLSAADIGIGFDDLEDYAVEASSKLEETARETMAPSGPDAEPRDDDRTDGRR